MNKETIGIVEIETINGPMLIDLENIKHILKRSCFIIMKNGLVYYCKESELEKVERLKNEYFKKENI